MPELYYFGAKMCVETKIVAKRKIE